MMPAGRMYFIGVETGASSAHRFFPRWAELLGHPGIELRGLDAPPDAPAETIRALVECVAGDALSLGALVTTHKVAVYEYARDYFRGFNADAELLREVACIVRSGGELTGIAVDATSCALPLNRLLPAGRFQGDVLIFGAGGAGRALAVHLRRRHSPGRVIVTDVSGQRLRDTSAVAAVECRSAAENDAALAEVGPGALVINATGLGKDRPGSPISDNVRFPDGAIAWDLNYRGDLAFLEQARRHGARTEDGWIYFISGWMHVMAHVLGRQLDRELMDRAVAVTTR